LTATEALQKALTSTQRKKSALFDARLSDPDLFSDGEFKEQKERLQGEINGLMKQIKKAEAELERVRTTVENVFDFAVNARRNFELGDARLRREIAGQLSVKYFLTLGKLQIDPHPLLVPILTFEPQESGSGNKKDGSDEAVRPSWLGMWDDVRTSAWEYEGHFARIRWEALVAA